MNKLKWYSGGQERGDQAITFITELLTDLNTNSKSGSLQRVLRNYKDELERKEAAVPLILSRMNMDISNAIRKDQITLSSTQSNKLKKLTSLSSIRYGYY